jgi:signal peptidase I
MVLKELYYDLSVSVSLWLDYYQKMSATIEERPLALRSAPLTLSEAGSAMNSESANKSVLSPQHLFTDVSTELLRSGQSIRFRAPGRSMYPTIKEDETITVQPVAPSDIKMGDIILYRLEAVVIAHRVVRIERGEDGGSRFILRGDASGALDEPVEPAQVLGKVVSVERGGHSIDLYSRSAKMLRTAYVWASRLKRWIIRIFLWV